MRMRTVTFQLIGYHGDDLATGSQTAVLGRPVCAPGIAGYQHIPLQSGLPANLFGKFQVLRLQIPAAHQGNRRFLQQLLVAPKPQTPRRIQPQPVMDRLRIRFRHPAEDPALLPRAPLQVMLQKDHILQKSDDPLRHFQAVAHSGQVPAFQMPVLRDSWRGADPLGQGPHLGGGQRSPVGVSQLAGQQQETLLPGVQRNLRLGGAGALTSSSVRLPSSPRIMGRMA